MIFDRVKNISQRLPYLYIPNTCYFDAECTISEKLNITFEMIVSDKNKVEEVCCSMISHLIAMFTLDD